MTDSNSPQDISELNPAALRIFFNMAAAWRLSEEQERALLGGPDLPLYRKWKLGNAESVDSIVLQRISHLLGIYKSLHTLFPDTAQADNWVKKVNTGPIFEGKSALDLMCAGNLKDLEEVSQYLRGQLD